MASGSSPHPARKTARLSHHDRALNELSRSGYLEAAGLVRMALVQRKRLEDLSGHLRLATFNVSASERAAVPAFSTQT